MAQACGVDFGTSNSTVGWQQAGRPALLQLEDNKVTLPSVVFFNADENETNFGRAALNSYLEGYEGRLMRSMKSLLGTALLDGQTEVQGRSLPFKELLTLFIGELKSRAERDAGQYFQQAVFGRPVHFIDDDETADQQAQNSLEEIARAVGFKDIAFQFEPIAAAIDYESRINKEELVLVADIGGGTSDFSLIRLSPERSQKIDRHSDILGHGGVHIGGTDFDKYLSLAHIMPLLGSGGHLSSGIAMPSSYYYNLATWHTINLVYTQKVARELHGVLREIDDADLRKRVERLMHLLEQRDGHWLAIQAEEAKIALSEQDHVRRTLSRLKSKDRAAEACYLDVTQTAFDSAIAPLMTTIQTTISDVVHSAGIKADQIDTLFFTGGSSGVRGLRRGIASLSPAAKQVEGDLFGSIGAGLGLDAARRYA